MSEATTLKMQGRGEEAQGKAASLSLIDQFART